MMHTYKSNEKKTFLCRVADGGQFPISLHQQLRLPSVDTVSLTGDLQMKTFHTCLRKAVLHCVDTTTAG